MMQFLSLLTANNLRWKKRLKELEDILNPFPLLMTPLIIRSPSLSIFVNRTPQIYNKDVNLLKAVKSHIINNTCQSLDIIDDSWK